MISMPMGSSPDLQTLWEDGERVFCRGWHPSNGGADSILVVRPAADHPSSVSLDRLAHEFELKDELDGAWAVRPLELLRENGRTSLVLEDPGGEPLERLLGAPMEVGRVLRFAVGIAAALGQLHQRGLVHKDLKPAHILVNCPDGRARLTGFGIASRLLREHQAPEPPETIAGTLAYMAPEQTGRMNRSIDSRSDLYAFGTVLYQTLTGALPFSATDPMEWVHCHIARQPVPPSERLASIPLPLSRIVMKLLAKTAEERYQTAAGAEQDLQRCLASWETNGRIDAFPFGEHDTPDRLVIPEKLYGREREVDALLAAFDRVVTGGAPELVLVSGYSGIGKSSVVNELHKVLVPPRGIFASGKFDQYKRNIPYSTLIQALQSLVRPLLGMRETELASWREALLGAIAPNARLMTDLIPELKLIIGEPPPVPELAPLLAQSRFQLVFRRFIGVFARPEHPLALFLDDLQWLDAATLDLLEDLLTRSDLQYLMVIGAYRDNEVDAAHPLMHKLEVIKDAGGNVREIALAPLAADHVGRLIGDAVYGDPARVAPLGQLVHEKTAGNPFFVIQFLYSLADVGLLHFDHDLVCWSWDLDRIQAKRFTDNVVDLMVGKLSRLPSETQLALKQLACMGNLAEIATLSTVLAIPEKQVHIDLWGAVCQGLVERLESAYRFMHDRIQEAAYSMIPEAMRAEVHLRLGRLLIERTPAGKREEAIFEIVNQLNRGAALITQQEERNQLVELNLLAGKRAKGSSAYASALTYLNFGLELLAEDRWDRQREVVFALELNRAECEFLTGQLSIADERLTTLSNRATTTVEHAIVACLHIDVCTTFGQSSRAIVVGLNCLRHFGIAWTPHPKDSEVRREYERIWSALRDRTIDDLIDLPLMEDPATLAALDVLSKLTPPAVFTDENLASLMICKAISLSLERGNCDASCLAYVQLARIAGPRFGDYQAGFRFGQLGYDLVGLRGLKRFEARTLVCFAHFVMPWMKHVAACRELLRRSFEEANRIGDPVFAVGASCHLNAAQLFAGGPLPEVQSEAEHGLAFVDKARFGLALITTQLALMRMLRGSTPTFGCLDDGQFNEHRTEDHLSSNPGLAFAACWYWIRKLQSRCIAGDHVTALDSAAKAKTLLWTTTSFFEEAEYYFYGALSHAACCDSAASGERSEHMNTLTVHHRQLKVWAEHCPENFESRAALVDAEIARIENRSFDAMRLYQLAIRSAHANGFWHVEALANEIAARFYAAREFEVIAEAYLQNARYCYSRWRADGKVRQLEQAYPHLRTGELASGSTGTIATPVEHLDLATVIKVSQAVSGDIVLDKLIETVMRTAIEHAGAERGLLILPEEGEQRIAAEATTGGERVAVHLRDAPVTPAALPESVLYYVLRTRESIILDDAVEDSSFAADPYIRQHRTRSILCLPLMNQAKLTGALYLENNLTTRVFTPARIAVLRLVVSQAAISLEIARLYRDVAKREEKIRRLVDANIIGIILWNASGEILEANDAFLRMVGYQRDDLVTERLRWTDLTPPEWREGDERALREIAETGRAQTFQKEYLKRDGSRVPVMLGAAAFEASRKEGVAFVLDLTESKQAEEKARESERRYREAQTELAHANRVATMGQLTASIAHEVNQPIAATITNAQTGLRWLRAQPPDLYEVEQVLGRIIKDTNRAGDVVGRILALVKKAPPQKEPLDINKAILEVIELTRGEAWKHGASVQTHLADGLPLIEGDRVRLQQVLLNLCINAMESMSGVSDGVRECVIRTKTADAGYVLVAVSDSGPGFGPDGAEQLFAPFYTTKSTGLGMGLSICRSIIEAHGGRLWASENGPRGAIFQFTVPALPSVS
ncbi:trifunctional serine/threonine-protein kinase/ATP-binding protein/sensor histidine kinase [Cupriavidus pauculus]|uniref:trifunctional serine/threonine-protein kinase/ATP-binding protein/sensor histidine kinase n=1 Tax=Cupriavidus pauculus TaxID=82633 RepID=UPI001EE1E657|nr:trifunctional serine/threonine-protein kinase/ATP-binding protein/sensor histidine kinase [Cupriavidus pauculus]